MMSIMAVMVFFLSWDPASGQEAPSLDIEVRPDRYPIYTDSNNTTRYITVVIKNGQSTNPIIACVGDLVIGGTTQSYNIPNRTIAVQPGSLVKHRVEVTYNALCAYRDGTTREFDDEDYIQWTDAPPVFPLAQMMDDYGNEALSILFPLIASTFTLVFTGSIILGIVAFVGPFLLLAIATGATDLTFILVTIVGGVALGMMGSFFAGKL